MISRFTLKAVWPVLFCLGLGLSACATPPSNDSTRDAIDAAINEGINAAPSSSPGSVKPPPQVSAALLPPLPDTISALADVEPRFDVTVSQAPAAQFFMGLVEGTPYNMVVHPEVTGEVSLNLKNVTVLDVMRAMRDVYGYDFQQNQVGFQVLPATLQSRIFKVDYLTINRRGNSQIRFSSNNLANSSNSSSSSASGSTTQQPQGTTTSADSQINTRSESDFWTELTASLRAIVGSEANRSVVVSPQSGVIVVRAMPDELRGVEEFLNTSQGIIQRQVILEAKILEVQLNDGFQSGINWSILGEPGEGQTITAGQRGVTGGIFGSSAIASSTGVANNLANPDPFLTTNGVFSLALALGDFNALIDLLKTQGNVQVLSSPRVSTVNNQKAVIKVGTDEFFVTGIETTQNIVSATTTQPTTEIQLTPFFSGITLDVIPQINEQGDVILHIHPTVSDVTDQQKSFTVGGQAQSLPLALSSTRESDSIIRAKNGQVVVIGGLLQNSKRTDNAGVPVLSQIPGFGALFRHTREASVKSELVILLRPIVVYDQQPWSESLQRSADAFKDLRREPAQDTNKDVVVTPSGAAN